jgi:hypothetical protein
MARVQVDTDHDLGAEECELCGNISRVSASQTYGNGGEVT